MRISDVSQYCTSFLTATDFLREKCILRRDIPRCKQCDGFNDGSEASRRVDMALSSSQGSENIST